MSTPRVQRPPIATDADDARVDPIRFGVLAPTSMVARLGVIPALEATPQATVVATASQSAGESYAELLDRTDVDAVYIPLPTGMHREWVEAAAAAGKHVLCEKPLAVTSVDTEAMVSACAHAGVTLMEAYMTPFHPRTVALYDLVGAGRIGRPLHVRAEFTFPSNDPDNHRWHPTLGGGALADVGIYCLTPIFEIASLCGDDAPASTECTMHRTDAGVDATTLATLRFDSGLVGDALCSMEAPERQLLEVTGTHGRLTVDREAFTPGPADTGIEFVDRDGERSTIEVPGADCYRGMVDHFCAVVQGRTMQRRPPRLSIGFARLCDLLRDSA